MSRQKEVNKMASHEEVERQKILPQVGNTVRSKKYGTLWRVMEKREMWEHSADDPTSGNTRLVPAIYLRYWKIQKGKTPGIGRMLGYTYTALDNTFESNWEIVD
jgi:hypothetical protein